MKRSLRSLGQTCTSPRRRGDQGETTSTVCVGLQNGKPLSKDVFAAFADLALPGPDAPKYRRKWKHDPNKRQVLVPGVWCTLFETPGKSEVYNDAQKFWTLWSGESEERFWKKNIM